MEIVLPEATIIVITNSTVWWIAYLFFGIFGAGSTFIVTMSIFSKMCDFVYQIFPYITTLLFLLSWLMIGGFIQL